MTLLPFAPEPYAGWLRAGCETLWLRVCEAPDYDSCWDILLYLDVSAQHVERLVTQGNPNAPQNAKKGKRR